MKLEKLSFKQFNLIFSMSAGKLNFKLKIKFWCAVLLSPSFRERATIILEPNPVFHLTKVGLLLRKITISLRLLDDEITWQ